MSWKQKLEHLERDYFDGTINKKAYDAGCIEVVMQVARDNETAQEGRSDSSMKTIGKEIADNYAKGLEDPGNADQRRKP